MSRKSILPVRRGNAARLPAAQALPGMERSPGEFRPTRAMRRFAEACNDDELKDDAARCERARITGRTLARWRNDPRFDPWVKWQVYARFEERGTWQTWIAVARRGRAGHLGSALAFLDRFDSAGPGAGGPATLLHVALLSERVPDAFTDETIALPPARTESGDACPASCTEDERSEP